MFQAAGSRGAPIPDTDIVAVAERSTIPLDVRSFGVVSQGVTLTAAAGGQSRNLREPSSSAAPPLCGHWNVLSNGRQWRVIGGST